MRQTRGEIINQAMQLVGNNSTTMLAQARIKLNRILQDLYQQWDWPFLWLSTQLSILPNGVIVLPADFVKPEDDRSLVVVQANGQAMRRIVQEVDHRTFDSRLLEVSGLIPQIWTIDYVVPVGKAWPLPDGGTAIATFRYKFLPPDVSPTDTIAYDADIPTFPWDSFLQHQLVEWGMLYESDPRRAEQLTIDEGYLQRLRGSAFPDRSYPSTVPLDPVFFSTPNWGYGRGSSGGGGQRVV